MSIVYYKDFLKAGPDTPGCITYDEPEKIASYIRDIKSRNRWCILVIHGGEEFASMPLPYVRKLYHQFLMELLRGRIFYRLGYWRLADPALVKYLQE